MLSSPYLKWCQQHTELTDVNLVVASRYLDYCQKHFVEIMHESSLEWSVHQKPESFCLLCLGPTICTAIPATWSQTMLRKQCKTCAEPCQNHAKTIPKPCQMGSKTDVGTGWPCRPLAGTTGTTRDAQNMIYSNPWPHFWAHVEAEGLPKSIKIL